MRPPTSEPAAPQRPSNEPLDPQRLWGQLLESAQNRPALGWLRSLKLDKLRENVVELKVVPGQREMVRFLGDRQKAQLAQMLSELAGYPLKVELQIDTSRGDAGDDDQDGRTSKASGRGGGGRSGGGISVQQRQEAMNLPLVRELMESFDLSLVDVRQQPKPGTKPDTDKADTDDDAAEDDLPSPAPGAVEPMDALASSDTLDDLEDNRDDRN